MAAGAARQRRDAATSRKVPDGRWKIARAKTLRRSGMKRLIVGALVCVAVAAGSAQMPKYGVTVKVAKNGDPAKYKPYTWTKGGPSADKTIDAQIVAAVDRELSGLGMSK